MPAAPQSGALSQELLARLPQSPDVLVHKLDLSRNAALLVEFSRGAYERASFLDDRILGAATKGGWVMLPRLHEAARTLRVRPVHFIFHTGHVGSTLLSRLLESTGRVLSLREPLALRDLADAADTVGSIDSLLSDRQFEELQSSMLTLWGRSYEATQSVVVKATSSASRLAPSILAAAPESRAIYMNLRAEPYLATLLGGQNSSIDLRGHGPGRIRRLQAHLSTQLQPLHALSLGELAAMSWLVETWTQLDLIARFGDRVMALNFDDFLLDVTSAMRRVLAQLDLPLDERYLAGVASSPVLSQYSKAAEFAYSPQVRAEVLSESRQRNAVEIGCGMRWLEALAGKEAGVARILSA